MCPAFFFQDTVFASLLDIVKTNLNGPRTEAYLTAVVSLGHIAFFMPDKYPVHIKNLVARNIVKQLIMQEGSEEVCKSGFCFTWKITYFIVSVSNFFPLQFALIYLMSIYDVMFEPYPYLPSPN